MSLEHFDVLIVGAGISGIGAACHLKAKCPNKTFAILEGREAIGGTWDLFRYPGIRSDSDMYTLGYSFRPWTGEKSIADGSSILEYLHDTAREHGVDRHVRLGHRVRRVSWSSAEAKWTVEIERGPQGEALRMSCNFLYMCCGYYRYESGYMPEFPGREAFKGRVVHPQQWTPDIDYTGQRVVVIGSGATAVTLVPAMARTAAHVTMLQRSPTYILSLPDRDAIANTLRRFLPDRVAYALTRWKNVFIGMTFFQLCRRAPNFVRNLVLSGVRKALGPAYPVEKDFSPSYKPWDQRVCLVPNADLFRAIRKGHASVVTDHIETFTERGIRLKSGKELEADLVVSATGLELLALGGVSLSVDGREIELSKTMSYRGMMCSDVPNLAIALGYTNASWTLKCDLTSEYVCRLLNFMDARGYRQCMPRNDDPAVRELPLIDFSSSYVLRSIDRFPRQGSRSPWKLYQNYLLDMATLKLSGVDDGVMVFSSPGEPGPLAEGATA